VGSCVEVVDGRREAEVGGRNIEAVMGVCLGKSDPPPFSNSQTAGATLKVKARPGI